MKKKSESSVHRLIQFLNKPIASLIFLTKFLSSIIDTSFNMNYKFKHHGNCVSGGSVRARLVLSHGNPFAPVLQIAAAA